MADQPVIELLPRPTGGRIHSARRLVRFGDLSPGGRLRLDAVARYLQDIASDDATDSGLEADLAWVVRRLVIEVRQGAVFREPLEVSTWCSGTGSRWAERRVSMLGDHGASIEAGALWVRVDFETGRPRRLGDDFLALYGESAAGRTVGVRLQHEAKVPRAAPRQAWANRFVDFDMLGHVNNAAYFSMIEEVLSPRRDLRFPFRAEIEFRKAVERGAEVELAVFDRDDNSLALWLVSAGSPGDDATSDGDPVTVYATGEVRVLP